jgi:tetratricopeptide (TPR) repeat protein
MQPRQRRRHRPARPAGSGTSRTLRTAPSARVGHQPEIPTGPRASTSRWRRLWEWGRRPTGPLRAIPRFVFVTLLGVASAGLGVYSFFQDRDPSLPAPAPVPPMFADLNIAVAPFTAVGPPALKTTADALARSLFEELAPQLAPLRGGGFTVQTRGPDQLGPVDGVSPAARAAQLAQLADGANADIVITAVLVEDGGTTRVAPELYLADRKLQVGAAEITGGPHRLGSLGSYDDPDGDIAARRRLRADLTARTRGIAHFTMGLAHYNNEPSGTARFADAQQEFEAALKDWTDEPGRTLLHLFLGNTAAKSGDLASAERHYRMALGLDRAYGRARIGLGELWYQRGCNRQAVTPTVLRRAEQEFQAVLDAADKPAGADLDSKARFGLGRTALCLSQARRADRWQEARAHFEYVIDDFGGNPRIKQLAAESHGGLGFVYLGQTTGDRHEALRRAADSFTTAAGLSRSASRRSVFLGNAAAAQADLGDAVTACTTYTKAIEADASRASGYEKARRRLPGCK